MSDETMRAELEALRRELAEVKASTDDAWTMLKKLLYTVDTLSKVLKPIASDWKELRARWETLITESRRLLDEMKKLNGGEDWKA